MMSHIFNKIKKSKKNYKLNAIDLPQKSAVCIKVLTISPKKQIAPVTTTKRPASNLGSWIV